MYSDPSPNGECSLLLAVFMGSLGKHLVMAKPQIILTSNCKLPNTVGEKYPKDNFKYVI